MWLWTLGAGGNGNGSAAEEEAETDEGDEEESSGGGKAGGGFMLQYDAARKIAQGLSVHLEELDRVHQAMIFDRTYMTESLLELCSQVVRRLSGVQVETSAVYNMATQFGGGKTHSETTAYDLATNGEKAKSWKGVERILAKAGVPQVPKADVAVFVGTEFDVIRGIRSVVLPDPGMQGDDLATPDVAEFAGAQLTEKCVVVALIFRPRTFAGLGVRFEPMPKKVA